MTALFDPEAMSAIWIPVRDGPGCLPPRVGDDPGAGKVVDVVARPALQGSRLAVAGERAVDEGGIGRPQRFIVQAEFRHDAGAELLDQDVVAL